MTICFCTNLIDEGGGHLLRDDVRGVELEGDGLLLGCLHLTLDLDPGLGGLVHLGALGLQLLPRDQPQHLDPRAKVGPLPLLLGPLAFLGLSFPLQMTSIAVSDTHPEDRDH